MVKTELLYSKNVGDQDKFKSKVFLKNESWQTWGFWGPSGIVVQCGYRKTHLQPLFAFPFKVNHYYWVGLKVSMICQFCQF